MVKFEWQLILWKDNFSKREYLKRNNKTLSGIHSYVELLLSFFWDRIVVFGIFKQMVTNIEKWNISTSTRFKYNVKIGYDFSSNVSNRHNNVIDKSISTYSLSINFWSLDYITIFFPYSKIFTETLFFVISWKIKLNSFIMFTSATKIITVKADCLSFQSLVNTFPWHCCSVMLWHSMSWANCFLYAHFHCIVNSIFHYKKKNCDRKRENEWKKWEHFTDIQEVKTLNVFFLFEIF